MFSLRKMILAGLVPALFGATIVQAATPGTPATPAFQVNPATSLQHTEGLGSLIGGDDAGDITVVRTEYAAYPLISGLLTQDLVWAARFDRNGNALLNPFLVSDPGIISGEAAVAVNRSTGDFVVVWSEDGALVTNLPEIPVFAAVFSPTGAPRSLRTLVATLPRVPFSLSVAMNRSGNFVVAWLDLGPETANPRNGSVNLAWFNAQGQQQGSTQNVAVTPVVEYLDGLGLSGDGHAMISWVEAINSQNFFIDCFSGPGASVQGPVQVSAGASATQFLGFPAAAQADDGTIAMAWQWWKDGSATGAGASARVFDSSCRAKGQPFTLHQAADDQYIYSPLVAVDSAGGQMAFIRQPITPGQQFGEQTVQAQFGLFSLSGAPLSGYVTATTLPAANFTPPAFDGYGNLWTAWGQAQSPTDSDLFARAFYGAPSFKLTATVAPAALSYPHAIANIGGLPQTVTLTNSGPGMLLPGTASITGADAAAFSISANGCTIPVAPGASCTLTVNFKPTQYRSYAATLNLPSNAGNGTQTVRLGGTGNLL